MQNEGNIKKIFNFLTSSGCTKQGAIGMIANMYAESRCNPLCVEALLIKRYKEEGFLKWDYGLYDENTYKQYWSYFDTGAISEAEFLSPRQYTGAKHQYGAGLCQWTSKSRKEKWLSLAKDDGKPLTDLDLQLNLLYYELRHTYTDVWSVLHQSINIDVATNYVLRHFEEPANAASLLKGRVAYAKEISSLLTSQTIKQEGYNMGIIIGSARIDENGHAHGGQAGDQTGREVSMQAYYRHSGGWRAFRLKDPSQAKRMAYAMKAACTNDNWGYDQYQRLSGMKKVAPYGYDPAKLSTPAETDCSNLVRVCFRYATGKDPGDFDTSGEASALLDTGLVDEVSFDQVTGTGLKEGDILVTRQKGHTVSVTDGPERTDAGTTKTAGSATQKVTGGDYTFTLPIIKQGSKGNAVLLFQEIFISRNLKLNWKQKDLELDGICGPDTVAAIRWYQKQRGLTADGECGKNTWSDLLGL